MATSLTLEILKDRFLTGLSRRLERLNENYEVLVRETHAETARPALHEMVRGFHSLAGIGGTYGFPHITDLGTIGELTCESVRLPLTTLDARMIKDVLESLDRAVAAMIRKERRPIVVTERNGRNSEVASPA